MRLFVLLTCLFAVTICARPINDSNKLFKNGDYAGALEKYMKAREAEPANPLLFYNIGTCQYRLGNFLFNYYDKFALLDTTANTITQITKEEAGWPDGVEDAQYFKDDLMTLNFISENHCEFGFMKNLRDTVAVHREDSCGYVHTRLQLNGWFVNRENFDQSNKSDCIFSTDRNWQISEKPVARYRDERYFAPLNRE